MNDQNWPVYAAVMIAAGIGIPILAALNAGLGMRIGSPVWAGAIGTGVAFSAALMAAFATGLPRDAQWSAVPVQYYLGGFFMAFYLLSISWAAPRFGIGNAVFCVLMGQIICAAAIDHYGLFGAPRSALGLTRFAGILLMIAGLYLARKPAIPVPIT
ncbi:MAG TPA: DMT family transporter [Sphingorhabdus sp.]|jgi:transporter family-2 protein|nr:DMT family transporter [Sphingorhabdus sp.]